MSGLEEWLKHNALWNSKRNRATTSLFRIPPIFISDEVPTAADVPTDDTPLADPTAKFVSSKLEGSEEERGLTCRGCSLTFESKAQQYAHFKSELHRLNLKRKLKGLQPIQNVSEEEKDESGNAVAGNDDINVDEDSDSSGNSDNDDAPRDGVVSNSFRIEDYLDDDDVDADAVDVAAGVSDSDGRQEASTEVHSLKGVVKRIFSHTEGPMLLFSPSQPAQTSSQPPTGAIPWDFTVSAAAVLVNCSAAVAAISHDIGGGKRSSAGAPPSANRDLYVDLAATARLLQDKDTSMICVMILRSGRFAAAIFDGQAVLVHKALRRYTVRAKAGGSQSSHDNQGRKAKSAGAMLRRYGEQALKEDIRDLLREWSAHLQTCCSIFVSCPKTMRTTIFDPTVRDAPVFRDDDRIRYVPFMVDKPTFEEVKMIHARCTTIVFQPRGTFIQAISSGGTGAKSEAPSTVFSGLSLSTIVEEGAGGAGGAEFEATGAVSAKGGEKKSSKSANGASNTAVELPYNGTSVRLFQACRQGDVDAVESLLQSLQEEEHSSQEHSGVNSEEYSGEHSQEQSQHVEDVLSLEALLSLPESIEQMSTCLHVAAECGHAEIVLALLRTGGADPTRVDIRSRPAYFLAKDKETRDAFRRARAYLGEDKWPWDSAGVPAALTEDLERQQREKEKEKKKRAKENKKKKKEKDEQEAADALRKAEEQRLAAEEEAKRKVTAAGSCAQCGKLLFGSQVYDVFDRRCCSSACVMTLRRKLSAEAAEKRFNK